MLAGPRPRIAAHPPVSFAMTLLNHNNLGRIHLILGPTRPHRQRQTGTLSDSEMRGTTIQRFTPISPAAPQQSHPCPEPTPSDTIEARARAEMGTRMTRAMRRAETDETGTTKMTRTKNDRRAHRLASPSPETERTAPPLADRSWSLSHCLESDAHFIPS